MRPVYISGSDWRWEISPPHDLKVEGCINLRGRNLYNSSSSSLSRCREESWSLEKEVLLPSNYQTPCLLILCPPNDVYGLHSGVLTQINDYNYIICNLGATKNGRVKSFSTIEAIYLSLSHIGETTLTNTVANYRSTAKIAIRSRIGEPTSTTTWS